MVLFLIGLIFQAQAQYSQAFRTLQKIEPEYFWRNQVFTFQNSLQDWTLLALNVDSSEFKKIYRFKKNQSESGFFQIEIQTLKGALDFQSASKKWVKDFSQLGFQVLQAKAQKINQQDIFIGDFLDPRTSKQSRFILLMNEKKAVTLTCTDDTKNFYSFLKDCQDKIKTFRWISSQGSFLKVF